MKKSLLIIVTLLTIATGLGGVPAAYAQTYTALEPLPCFPSAPTKDANGIDIPGTGVVCTSALRSQFNFSDYMQFVFNLVIAISASAAVFMIVWGGFQYMTTDSWNGKSEGIEKLKSALLGLLLVLTSYMILRTVNPALVAIPTTLVTPLDINYAALRQSSAAAFLDDLMGMLESNIDRTRAENRQILADVTLARSQIVDLERERTDLCESLREKLETDYPTTPIPPDCKDVVQMAGAYQQEVQRYHSLEGQINTKKVAVATQVGVGTMNGEILKCAAGADFNTCNNMIADFRTKYNQQLGALSNDPTLQTKLNDYARYASMLAYANSQVASVVDTTTLRPIQAALREAAVGGAAIVGGATGAIVGSVGGVVGAGVVGVAAGAGARDGTRALIESMDRGVATGNAEQAAQRIFDQRARLVASITDPELKALALAQSNAIIAGLRGLQPRR